MRGQVLWGSLCWFGGFSSELFSLWALPFLVYVGKNIKSKTLIIGRLFYFIFLSRFSCSPWCWICKTLYSIRVHKTTLNIIDTTHSRIVGYRCCISPQLFEYLPHSWMSFASLFCQGCGHPCCLCTFFNFVLVVSCFSNALDLSLGWRISMSQIGIVPYNFKATISSQHGISTWKFNFIELKSLQMNYI